MANYELLRRLCMLDGISGREDAVRAVILDEIRPYCRSVQVDPLGSIIAEKAGRARPARKLMLDAHLDEVGLMVTYISDDGMLHFDPVGGINEKVLAGIPVLVGDAHIPGVIGLKPIHLCKDDEESKPVSQKKLVIDIGADSREEAEKWVASGDSVIFRSTWTEQEGILQSKAFDDRAGCAALIELIRSNLPYDMTFTFSVQEELGLRGARATAYTVAPDAAIVLEATTACDIVGTEEARQACRVGQGAVISFMDRATCYDRAFYQLAFESARAAGVAAQPKTAVAGGNDSGAVHLSRGGVRTIAVSVPCRYLHAPMCMIAKKDYEAVIATVRELAGRIAGGQG